MSASGSVVCSGVDASEPPAASGRDETLCGAGAAAVRSTVGAVVSSTRARGDEQRAIGVLEQVLTELGLDAPGHLHRYDHVTHVVLEGGWLLTVEVGIGPVGTVGERTSGWSVRLERGGCARGAGDVRRVDDTDSSSRALRVLLQSLLHG